jgi:stalled ribosome rescue protein Dom34
MNAPSPLFHAVVAIDHHEARILQFDAEHVQASRVKASSRHSRKHGSAVRTEHEFDAEVCEALAGIAEVLVTGSHTALADFRHYVEKHRPATGRQIVGWEVVDHPTDPQLVALARRYFLKYDRMAGTPTPS